jgi:hypothetical protein
VLNGSARVTRDAALKQPDELPEQTAHTVAEWPGIPVGRDSPAGCRPENSPVSAFHQSGTPFRFRGRDVRFMEGSVFHSTPLTGLRPDESLSVPDRFPILLG